MDNLEQPRFVEDFWNSPIGRGYQLIIEPTIDFTKVTNDKPFPPEYFSGLSDLAPGEELYAGLYHAGTPIMNEGTYKMLQTLSDVAGHCTSDFDWVNVLRLQTVQYFLSHETAADEPLKVYKRFIPDQIQRIIPQYKRLRSKLPNMSVNLATIDAKNWNKSRKEPDLVMCTYIARELASQPPGRERFPTLVDFEKFATERGIKVQWREILEGFENIMSEKYVRGLVASGKMSREDMPSYFANVTNWVIGAALKWQQELTTDRVAEPFFRKNIPVLDPPIEALPMMIVATRYFYENLPMAVTKNSAIAPSDLIINGLNLINYLKVIKERKRSVEDPLVSSDLPYATIEDGVWDQVEEEAKKLEALLLDMGKNPGLLTRRERNPQQPSTSLRHIAEKRQEVQETGGKNLYWGAAHFPFADRSGVMN